MPEGSAASGGHSAEGDWAAMAVWDLLTPSTSQSTCGNVDEGDFVGAAMAVWDTLSPVSIHFLSCETHFSVN